MDIHIYISIHIYIYVWIIVSAVKYKAYTFEKRGNHRSLVIGLFSSISCHYLLVPIKIGTSHFNIPLFFPNTLLQCTCNTIAFNL